MSIRRARLGMGRPKSPQAISDVIPYDIASMATSTVENYIKQILHLQREPEDHLVPMGVLAKAMNVAPGTATAMIKALSESGLVVYEPRTGVRLTAGGEGLAMHVLRRHRLVELFLVEVLGLDWSEVHDEAEELEHAISDKVLERIDNMLGHPHVDPHGDPIPTAAGAMREQKLQPLLNCAVGTPVLLARVLDQDGSFLRFLDQQGLTLGVELTVTRRDAVADAVTLVPAGGVPVIVGTAAAAKLMVKAESR